MAPFYSQFNTQHYLRAKSSIQHHHLYYLIYLMESNMLESPHSPPLQNIPSQEKPISFSKQKNQSNNPGKQGKVHRRPGRPCLRGRGRLNLTESGRQWNPQKDEDFQIGKQRTFSRNMNPTEQNNMEGFIKIIDYLKKIDCDETSLHNKMNPYNLLTATCFWYIVSAEYFSFDFFNNRNPNGAANQILKRAQKTYVTLPQRIQKITRQEHQLDFENPQLREASYPITDRLMNLIKYTTQLTVDGVEKATYITSVSEDDYFRSSTRALIFNQLKKKLNNKQKGLLSIETLLESLPSIPDKELEYYTLICEQQEKAGMNQISQGILYRQKRKLTKDPHAKPRPVPENFKKKKNKSSKGKNRKKSKAKNGKNGDRDGENNDHIFHQSEDDQRYHIPANADNQPKQMQQQNIQEKEEAIDEENNEPQVKEEQSDSEEEQDDDDQAQVSKYEYQKQIQNLNQVKDQLIKMEEEAPQKVEEEPDKSQMEIEEPEEPDFEEPIKKQSNRKMITKKYTTDDVLLDSLLHLPIDHVINLLQDSLPEIELPPITKDILSLPKQDPLDLVYQIHPEEQKFLQYMKNRQQKIYLEKMEQGEKFEQKQRETQFEDAKCQVCTDGDYTEDNLIVFCSTCGISVHQRCVGLNKIPSQNWICEVCTAFGPAGCNVPCPLCDVKGGALKRTSIHINQPLFKDTNPNFHQYAKSCPFVKQKQEYSGLKLHSNGQPESYYDYFTKQTYPQDAPVCHYVWIHYTCAIWVPECYFQEKNSIINIKGIENIDKKRFKEKCFVCDKVKGGACVKCQHMNCNKYYHSECARKKRVYMEQLNLDRLRYLIFCEAHEPLKVKRKIDVKKKKGRDQIIKFCRGIEKYVQTYKIAPLNFKLMKAINSMESLRLQKLTDGYSKYNSNKNSQSDVQQKVIVKLERNNDEHFIRNVIQTLNKFNQIVVNLTKLGENRFKVDEVVKPSKRDMRKSLNRIDEFWKNFNNGQSSDVNLKRFNTIMRENLYLKERIQNFINYGDSEQPRAYLPIKKIPSQCRRGVVGRRPKIARQTIIEQEGGIFCVCRKAYEGQTDMFQCQVCNQWYHHQCIGFCGSEQDAQSLDFHCMKCMKYQSPQVTQERLKKCAKFFRENSLFLNYRPPTPSLQSQQERMINHVQEEGHSLNKVEDNNLFRENNASKGVECQRLNKHKTKILAILDKPFIVEGPKTRTDNDQFYQRKYLVLQKILKEEERGEKIKANEQNMQYYNSYKGNAPNFMQMQSVSFKGQFINNNKDDLEEGGDREGEPENSNNINGIEQ